MAGVLTLLLSAVIRLGTGLISSPEVLFDVTVATTPGRVESAVIMLTRHAAKPLLLAASAGAILAACAVVGAIQDRLAASRGAISWARVLVLSTLPFPLVGVLAAGVVYGPRQPQLLVAIVGSQIAFVSALLLWGLKDQSLSGAAGPEPGRREFLGLGLRLIYAATLGTLGALVVQRVRVRMRGAPVDVAAVLPPAPPEGVFRRPELAALVRGEVTPTPWFYRVSKNALDPELRREGWKLAVTGLVGRPLQLAADDLDGLRRLERYHTLICISNELGDGLIGNAGWAGVRLADVLDQAQVLPEARFVTFRCADGYVESISMEQARQTLLVQQMNGAPLESRHGFPLRALVPGTYGMKNPKWIVAVEAAAAREEGFWTKLGWTAGAAPKIFSRIDVPRRNAVVRPGEVVLGGIAFAGNRGIARVEVSDDEGTTWQAAALRPTLSPNSWALWGLVWIPRGSGERTLMVRAVDGTDEVQSATITDPFPSGVSGYHRITVTVTE